MPTLLTEPDLFAFELGVRQTARVLEQAVRARARVTLQPRMADDTTEWTGRIVAAAPESFCIELNDGTATVAPMLPSLCCDATVDVLRDRYLFATNIMAVVDTDSSVRLEIARPRSLQVMQRRRFWRAEIRHSSTVELRRAGDDSVILARGPLLNASVEGLACRIAGGAADRCQVGDTLGVGFEVPGHAHRFELAAIVRSKTSAGDPDATIVGLELVFDGERTALRQRLAEALGLTDRQPGEVIQP